MEKNHPNNLEAYRRPELELVSFDNDVILTSGCQNDFFIICNPDCTRINCEDLCHPFNGDICFDELCDVFEPFCLEDEF